MWKDTSFIEKVLLKVYGIKAASVKELSSGFNSVSYQIDDGFCNYSLRVSSASTERIEKILTDIRISQFLHDVLPTSWYVKSLQGNYFEVFEDCIIRLTFFLEGYPFDSKTQPLELALSVLKKIHSSKLPDFEHSENVFGGSVRTSAQNVLLHGDFIPSNLLMSHGKISGVLDFEHSFIGPLEYDLASFISHFCMPYSKKEMELVIRQVVADYGGIVRLGLLHQYLVHQLDKSINPIVSMLFVSPEEKLLKKQHAFILKKKEEVLNLSLEFE